MNRCEIDEKHLLYKQKKPLTVAERAGFCCFLSIESGRERIMQNN